ncbi:unnamed protein product [Closterium sp. Yama58-4]|nr:unnamed protein product [Closterium sp. Yama58-4]
MASCLRAPIVRPMLLRSPSLSASTSAVAGGFLQSLSATSPSVFVPPAWRNRFASAGSSANSASPAIRCESADPAVETRTAESAAEPEPSAKKGKAGKKGGGGGGGQGKGGGKGAASAEASKIASRSENFSRWYLDVIREAELADYGPVRGTMVIRPYGYAIWEAIQSWLDRKFKETGHENMYFPQFIPYSFIEKEASHVEGFSPELALVTIGGGKELEERLVVRPTSETIVNHMFAQWIQSYRDLPLLINQWANVTRWEMSTRPFVRTLEFLWQEGHTAHSSREEAEEEALRMVEVYRQFAWEQAAVPVIVGRKSPNETFAGAETTYTIEAMAGDRRALQAGTSHFLGQNFAKAFGSKYLAETGEQQYVWQTSWGVSTRMVGAVIMGHGDDMGLKLPPNLAPVQVSVLPPLFRGVSTRMVGAVIMGHGDDMGLKLPPNLAPVQVVIVPIWKAEGEKEVVLEAAGRAEGILRAAGVRVKLDKSEQRTPGFKFNFWEMKGVPVRIEIGPRDVAANTVVTARRDRPGKQGKKFGVSMGGDGRELVSHVQALLQEVQDGMLADAVAFRDSHIVDVTSYEELKEAIASSKWARGPWAGSNEDEQRVKEETGATLRCFPFEPKLSDATCFFTGNPATERAIFSRAY